MLSEDRQTVTMACKSTQLATLIFLSTFFAGEALPADAVRSHPPLRKVPPPSDRPLNDGPAYFVDSVKGDDGNSGKRDEPWKTIAHAVEQLGPGDTLYLRGGTYYEHVAISLAGREEKPITIRSFPGEQAILDASLREFFEQPEMAWQSFAEGAPGEFRSARPYRNLRTVIGCFGDSMVGLNTYYHLQDLRSEREVIEPTNPDDPRSADIKPLYCGPGMWYDAESGYIHVRLAHTHVAGIDNYQGETDPRKLPLVIAPFRSVPLELNGAKHVRLQDLVIRGGGYDTVVVDYGQHIEFDNVTVWCGTYGMRTARTGPLKFHNSALYGNCPPWLFRGDTSKRAYPGRPFRDITRLNTHANWVIEAGREFSVFAHPVNDDWEISYSEFTDAHDGPYFGGVNLRFHHNLIDNTQDDGVYLSQMYPRHLYMGDGAEIHVYQNLFRGCLTAWAFGGPEETRDRVFIYRNVVDLTRPVQTGRPRAETPDQTGISYGKLMGDHGSPPWPAMNIYHNTIVARQPARRAAMSALGATHADRPRRVFNNLFLHLARLPGYLPPSTELNAQADGNLYWSPAAAEMTTESFFRRYRSSPDFEASKKVYPPGFTTHSFVADPRFIENDFEKPGPHDFRLQKDSPAVNAGVKLPGDWPDPLADEDAGGPDIGAVPLGAEEFRVGRK